MRKLIIPFLILFIILSKNQKVDGQIVNVEDRRTNFVDTIGWFGFAEAGANLVKNTRSITSISGNFSLERVGRKNKLLFLTNYNLVRVNSERFIDNGFQHIRFDHFIRDRIEYEIFAQAQFNSKLRILLRGLLGTGLRFHVLEVDNGKIFWGLSYMYEYDEIKIDPEKISYFRDHRMSTYLSVSVKVNDNFSLSNTSYYQPVLKQFSDVRLSSQTTLEFYISKRFSFTTTFNITNDTRVPQEVPATYYNWSNGIRVDF